MTALRSEPIRARYPVAADIIKVTTYMMLVACCVRPVIPIGARFSLNTFLGQSARLDTVFLELRRLVVLGVLFLNLPKGIVFPFSILPRFVLLF